MAQENWIQILVVVIILGTLDFLASRVLDMSQTLGSIDATVTATKDRVDRIAEELPGVGVRVAYEEVRKPIRTLVITTKPAKEEEAPLNRLSVFLIWQRTRYGRSQWRWHLRMTGA